MTKKEKLKKVCDDFSLLNDSQQEYILGILQALVFANNHCNENDDNEKASFSTKSK